MQHRGELAIHEYLRKVSEGRSSMSKKTIKQIAKDVEESLTRQFSSKKKKSFDIRMSNVGRPSCQLWFEKNHPEKALPKPNTFIMNMLIGDIVEAIFKGLLTEAKVDYKNSEKVTLDIGDNSVSGTYDLIIDGAVDDIKSASDWSYKYKFESFDSLAEGDSFGYIGQLTGYALASDSKIGGWWVVNKTNGNFKYVPATNVNVEKELSKIKDNIKRVDNKELVRCFSPEPEYFRGKPTGNTILSKNCTFCDFRQACWETLETLPAKMSKAKEPKMVHYVNIKKEKNI